MTYNDLPAWEKNAALIAATNAAINAAAKPQHLLQQFWLRRSARFTEGADNPRSRTVPSGHER
jgi:hypothetical protein